MILRKIHVEYWQAKKAMPRFAKRLYTSFLKRPTVADPMKLIHGCINAHAEESDSLRRMDANNLMSLCRSVIQRKEDLVELLRRLSVDPGTVINPRRRAAYARKWGERILKQRRKRAVAER